MLPCSHPPRSPCTACMAAPSPLTRNDAGPSRGLSGRLARLHTEGLRVFTPSHTTNHTAFTGDSHVVHTRFTVMSCEQRVKTPCRGPDLVPLGNVVGLALCHWHPSDDFRTRGPYRPLLPCKVALQGAYLAVAAWQLCVIGPKPPPNWRIISCRSPELPPKRRVPVRVSPPHSGKPAFRVSFSGR